MSAIQVKNVPEELHTVIRKRAADQGPSVSDYVLGLIRKDVALPTRDEWLAMVKARGPIGKGDVDVVKVLEEARAEWDEELDAKLRRD